MEFIFFHTMTHLKVKTDRNQTIKCYFRNKKNQINKNSSVEEKYT